MTDEQRYLFDVNGFLHLRDVMSDDELTRARAAAEEYLSTPENELPEGFSIRDRRVYEHGFAWNKDLEMLVFHSGYWSIVKEFTANKPMFKSGSMLVNLPYDDYVHAGRLHCAREDFGWFSTRYDTRGGKIYCDDFVIFPYLYDVREGDGGLAVIPGTHKSNFPRPDTLFNGGDLGSGLPEYAVNVTPKAGDVVIMTEGLTHGALRWTPTDRKRVVFILRYGPQFRGSVHIPDVVMERLSPETKELIMPGSFTDEKEIAFRDRVELS